MRGRVYLVGAGPGDPGLLTARALELIAAADTILYDKLIPAEALDGAREDAELLFVGKEGGGESVPQEQTEALLVERALAGREVVRLKGGDPFVFGRGGEEASALREAGIDFEVVPGVTAGVAAPAYAGIPVTHRGVSAAVAFVTGHEDPTKGESALDWQALASFPGTLVFYMGVRRLTEIVRSLLAGGRPADEPVAVVERGTLPGQRLVRGTLADIAEIVHREQVRAPAITVVGAVAGLADRLAWLKDGPLTGLTVAVTRARAQSSGLARTLSALGAEVIQAPTIRIRPLPGPPLDPSGYDLVCLTSPNGVAGLFERLAAGGRDARSLAGARVAAIGPGTARELAAHGIAADVLPERFVAESLIDALAEVPVRRALVARAKEARDTLPEGLRARGAEVDVVALYETLAEPLSAQTYERVWEADYVTFTSSSTVRFFLEAPAGHRGEPVGADPAQADVAHTGDTRHDKTAASPFSARTKVVSIGPVTSATLREHGIEPHVEAERHDVEGLIAALVTDAQSR
jgi:uroporphyrinogen III methyltransferase/synthase